MKNSFLLLALLLLAACKTNTTNRRGNETAIGTSVAQHESLTDSIDVLLREVLQRDQQVRNDYNRCVSENDRKEKLEAWEKGDSLNLSIVLPIIDSIMEGRLTDLSSDSWRSCFLVLQHAPSDVQMDYRDFVVEYYKKGYIMAYEYMIFIDRLLVGENRMQIFGSQIVVFPGGKRLQFPLCEKSVRDSAIVSLGYSPSSVRMKDGSFSVTLSEQEAKKVPTASSVLPTDRTFTDAGRESESSVLPGSLVLAKDEFGIILCMKEKAAHNPKKGIEVLAGNKVKGITDENGFVQFVVKKGERPSFLQLRHPDGKVSTLSLQDIGPEQDYTIKAIE